MNLNFITEPHFNPEDKESLLAAALTVSTTVNIGAPLNRETFGEYCLDLNMALLRFGYRLDLQEGPVKVK